MIDRETEARIVALEREISRLGAMLAQSFERVFCSVYKDSVTTLTTGVNTALTFNQTEMDAYGMHDPGGSYPGRIYVPYAGLYIGGLMLEFAANGTGRRVGQVLCSNSSGLVGQHGQLSDSSASVCRLHAISKPVICAVGNYFYAQVLQTSGGDLDLSASGEFQQVFWVAKLP